MGFAAKRLEPKIGLGTFFLAALWADLVWPIFLFFGVERASLVDGLTKMNPLDLEYYPYSHSLLALALWGGALGFVLFLRSKNLRGAMLVALCVLSHWVLDVLTHRPDVPLAWGDSIKLGFGLWNRPFWAFIIEGSFFATCVWLYFGIPGKKRAKKNLRAWGFIGFLSLMYLSQFSGKTPPAMSAVIAVGMFQWIAWPWGRWIDRGA